MVLSLMFVLVKSVTAEAVEPASSRLMATPVKADVDFPAKLSFSLSLPASTLEEMESDKVDSQSKTLHPVSEEQRHDRSNSLAKIKYRMICQCGSANCRKYLF